jgi:hypothetical protein
MACPPERTGRPQQLRLVRILQVHLKGTAVAEILKIKT